MPNKNAVLSDKEIFAAQVTSGLPDHPHGGSQEVLHFARLIESLILSRASSSREEVERDAARCIECGGTGTSDGRDGALIPCLACHSESPSRPAACIPEAWREFVGRVAKQKPEKPDYWSSCSQCEHNISDAEDLLSADEAPKEGAGE